MSEVTLSVEVRESSGKGAGRRLRREGKVPGIIYGKKVDSVPVQVSASALQRLLQSGGSGGLIRVSYGDTSQVVLVKDVQADPVLGTPVHVDFHAVALDQDVQVDVPLVVVGDEQRTSDGGILAQNLRELPISCLPTDIPESITVDVSGLAAGDSLTVGDIELPEGVKLNIEEDETVLSIVLPRAEATEEEADDAEEAGAEASEASEAADGDESESSD